MSKSKSQRRKRKKAKKLTVAKCRRLLGDDYASLSDKEIEELRDYLDAIAEIVIDTFIQKNTP